MNINYTLTDGYRRAVRRFLSQSRGVIAIEAAILLVAFATIVNLIIDLGTAFVQQSRLERATYTTASVLRERISLYGDPITNLRARANQPIEKDQVTQLREITKRLVDRDDLIVMVEEVQFALPPSGTTPASPTIETGYPVTFIASEVGTLQISGGPGTQGCKSTLPDIESNKYTALSPWSARQRWLPIYRVTVCYPGEKSWFKSMVNSSGGEDGLVIEELMAYNIVLPR